MGDEGTRKYPRRPPIGEDDTDPLKGQENAEVREVLEARRFRKRLVKRLAFVMRWLYGLPPFILSAYAVWQLWQTWHSK